MRVGPYGNYGQQFLAFNCWSFLSLIDPRSIEDTDELDSRVTNLCGITGVNGLFVQILYYSGYLESKWTGARYN